VQKKGVVSCVFSLGGGQIYKFILNNKKKSRAGIRDPFINENVFNQSKYIKVF